MVLRGRFPRILALGRILRIVMSWNCGQRDCLGQGSGRNILKRDNWRKLNEGTVNKGVGRVKRNDQDGRAPRS